MRADVIRQLTAGGSWKIPMAPLANAFFFFALLPFVSPMPGRSDVQVPAFVLASTIVAADVLRGKFRLRALEYAFLAVAVWSFCFVLPDGVFTLRERIGLPLAFMTYYVVKKHGHRFSGRVLYAAIALNFAAAVFQLAFPAAYVAFAPYVIRTVKEIGFMGRGMSGLSAEPSFLAAMALSHGLLTLYFRRYENMSPGLFWTGLGMSIAALALSRSATGFVFFVILFGIALLYYAIKGMRLGLWAGLLLSAVMAVGLVAGPLADSRGGVILTAIYENPQQVLADGSAQERTRCLTIGVLSMLHYPFGSGGGGFTRVSYEMEDRYRLDQVFEYARRETVFGVLNAGGLYFAEMGVVFLFFLGVVLVASFRLQVLHMMFSWLALMFMLITFSITFPLTWILLGLTARRRVAAGALPAGTAAA